MTESRKMIAGDPPRNGSSCGCGTCGSGKRSFAEPGGSRAAVGVDPEIKAANLHHLRRIEGQVGGLLRMVEQDRYCADIVTQVAAVRESLQSVAKNLLRNHLRHCTTAALRKGGPDAEQMHDELVDLVGKIAR